MAEWRQTAYLKYQTKFFQLVLLPAVSTETALKDLQLQNEVWISSSRCHEQRETPAFPVPFPELVKVLLLVQDDLVVVVVSSKLAQDNSSAH